MALSTVEIAIGGVVALGAVALAVRGGSAATPPSGPLASGAQQRPFPMGWYSDPAQSAAVGAIERHQLNAVGFPCTDDATCATATQNFASAGGLPDPFAPENQNEATAQALAYALDDKYRVYSHLGPAPSGSLLGRVRSRQARR